MTTVSVDLALEPFDLRVPAVDLGLELHQDCLRFFEARVGRLDFGRRHVHHLLGQRDPLLVEHNVRLLRP